MNRKFLPYSLILLLLIINSDSAFDADSIFFKICYMLPVLLLLSVILCPCNKIRYNLSKVICNHDLKLLFIFTCLIIIGLIRSTQLDVLSRINIFYDILYSLLIFFYALQVSLDARALIKYLFIGIFLYLMANILLVMIGVENLSSSKTIAEEASMLKYVGVNIERMLYPLTLGTSKAVPGIMSGTLLVYLLAMWPIFKNKILLLLLALVPFWVIISTDSRSSLLACLLSLSLFYFARTFNLKSIRFLPFAIPLFPILILLFSFFAFESGLSANLAREGSADISTGRSIIWAIAFNELSDFKPIHLIGYGSYGQTVSGISYDYMNLFKSWSDSNPELYSVHNAAIQMVFDIGYIGLVLFIYMLYRLLTVSLCSDKYELNSLAPVLLFIMLSGVSEITPLIYNNNMFSIFMIVAIYLAVNGNNEVSDVKLMK
jgi:hypothetical protein